MTTSHSPLRVLKGQADKIAATLKAIERGETPNVPHVEKLIAARGKETVSVAVVMDDKALKIELPWATIRESSEAGLSEFVLKQMRGSRDATH